jgi:hypothetical protein
LPETPNEKGVIMTTSCTPKPSNVRQAHLHEAPAIPSPDIADFVPACDRLEQYASADQFAIEKEVQKAAALRRRSVQLYDPLEDWLYSLIPAAAIIGLLIGVLGLLDSSSSNAADVRTARPGTEHSLSAQGKDGKF